MMNWKEKPAKQDTGRNPGRNGEPYPKQPSPKNAQSKWETWNDTKRYLKRTSPSLKQDLQWRNCRLAFSAPELRRIKMVSAATRLNPAGRGGWLPILHEFGTSSVWNRSMLSEPHRNKKRQFRGSLAVSRVWNVTRATVTSVMLQMKVFRFGNLEMVRILPTTVHNPPSLALINSRHATYTLVAFPAYPICNRWRNRGRRSAKTRQLHGLSLSLSTSSIWSDMFFSLACNPESDLSKDSLRCSLYCVFVE